MQSEIQFMKDELVLDLHIHSRFSRAVSQQVGISSLHLWAQKKGISVIGTGDFTHPIWFSELKSQLEETGVGVYQLRAQTTKKEFQPYFLLTTELACIYKEGGKQRRVHVLVCAPTFEVVEKINAAFINNGFNITSDGRPILGISLRNLSELLFSIDPEIMLIPAHIWTPWFGTLGSKSGYDSLDEAFGEYSKYIYAVESGLSSDPAMNWGVDELESRSIVSFSDAHSLAKMGREATVLKLKNGDSKSGIINSKIKEEDITYKNILNAFIRGKEKVFQIGYTIEFYPHQGKYHDTGHRLCGVCYSVRETREKGIICPVCGRPLTVGVMHRVDTLSGGKEVGTIQWNDEYEVTWTQDLMRKHPPFVNLVPLQEIIAASLGVGPGSKKVNNTYEQLLLSCGSEVSILLKTPLFKIKETAGEQVARGVEMVRRQNLSISPGFDGEYGIVKLQL